MICKICKICNNADGNRALLVREMYFGSKEVFKYFECSACGSLQIIDQPSDMEEAYPSDYDPFKKVKYRQDWNFIAALGKKKDRYTLFKKGITGRLINAASSKSSGFASLFGLMGDAHVRTNSRILDVGCGAGNLLDYLLDLGFADLTGIDPYAPAHIGAGVKILSITIEDLADSGKFDVIIFNHSFEHLADQLGALQKTSALLSKNGVCLIRMPVKTEYIWDLYGTNWVQLDAPRHYTIHTVKSFEFLLEKTDLTLEHTVFDSGTFQFVGSEQYVRGIPLTSENAERAFNARQMRVFKKLAKQLNRAQQGDRAAFCLRKN
ncbi:MAG: class I SAM-dependent methyltransferase [Halobacteriota archaeon]